MSRATRRTPRPWIAVGLVLAVVACKGERHRDRSPGELLEALRGLTGWDQLDAGNRAAIERLASGATNKLSIRVRRYLSGVLAEKLSGDEVRLVLGQITTAGAALPDTADEDVTAAVTAYTVEGPTLEAGHDFRGKIADARRWVVRFRDGTRLDVLEPVTSEPGLHNNSVPEVIAAASRVPQLTRRDLHELVLSPVANPDDAYWAARFHDSGMRSSMTTNAAGELTIYPDPVTRPLTPVLRLANGMVHEAGHAWSQRVWGYDKAASGWRQWRQAAEADGAAVSRYARESLDEDLAETVQVYASLAGSPRFEEYRAILPHRFAILDRLYAAR